MVAMEDAQESIRCDTFVILEHEEYRGGRQYNPGRRTPFIDR